MKTQRDIETVTQEEVGEMKAAERTKWIHFISFGMSERPAVSDEMQQVFKIFEMIGVFFRTDFYSKTPSLPERVQDWMRDQGVIIDRPKLGDGRVYTVRVPERKFEQNQYFAFLEVLQSAFKVPCVHWRQGVPADGSGIWGDGEKVADYYSKIEVLDTVVL